MALFGHFRLALRTRFHAIQLIIKKVFPVLRRARRKRSTYRELGSWLDLVGKSYRVLFIDELNIAVADTVPLPLNSFVAGGCLPARTRSAHDSHGAAAHGTTDCSGARSGEN